MRIVLLFVVITCTAAAQSTEKLLEDGARLEMEFKPAEALKCYLTILKSEPSHVRALIQASRMTSNQAGHTVDIEKRREVLAVAERYAQKAIGLAPDDADAHFSLLVVLGLMSEIAPSPREKIKDAMIVKEEAEKIIAIDPNYALAYFVLGKWHYELSKLNWLERVACDLFFGGLPEGVSMAESVRYFTLARDLDPEQIIILYGHATVLHYEGKDAEAIAVLEKALRQPLRDMDDALRKEKCKALLKEISD